MEVPTNPTRQSAFVWICGSFFISANEIRVSREDFFCSGTETHGDEPQPVSNEENTLEPNAATKQKLSLNQDVSLN
jgi:hypothetical protein